MEKLSDKEKEWLRLIRHKQRKQKMKASPEEKRKMLSTFMLTFPSVVVGVIALGVSKSFLLNAVVVMLVFYQLLQLRAFIEDYYKKSY